MFQEAYKRRKRLFRMSVTQERLLLAGLALSAFEQWKSETRLEGDKSKINEVCQETESL